MTGNVARGRAFEQDVEQLLRLKGYSVTRNELINGTQIDLVARKNDLLDNLCFVVECTDRNIPVGVDLVKQKAAVLLSLNDNRFLFRLIFVAKNDFTAEAKAYATSQPNVLLLTPIDLEHQLIDFGPYINWYLYNYENSSGIFKEGKLFNHYVELIARDEKDNIISSLTEGVRRWLSEDSNNLLFLLGEYGSGKTSFCRQFVYELLQEKYKHRSEQTFIPILINLREHRSGSPNLQQVITDTLINHYGVQLPSFMAFEHVCSSGRILLVLDGFDEMAEKSDKQTLTDTFNQIYLLASLNAKTILTCRSNFFHSHTDIIDLFRHFSINIPFNEESKKKIVQLTFEHQGRVLYVERLNKDQIRQFIGKRFGAEAEAIYTQINSIHDLSDLSTRPVLLDMILTTLPELGKVAKKINSAALYQHYTDKWTARDDWRVKIPLNIRQNLSEILGWVMHNSRVQEIDYQHLEKLMIRSLEPMVENIDQLETFKNDIQTCSFLVRIGKKDHFRFAHKSFQEFFVAKKIMNDLSKGLEPTPPKFDELYKTNEKNTGSIPTDEFLFLRNAFIHDWPYTKFDSTYRILGSRIRSSDAFITIRNNMIGSSWIDVKSENAVRNHLEEQIKEVLSKKGISDKSESLGLSPEISTFAIEYLSNLDISLRDFLSKLKEKESLAIFCDLLRLSQSFEFVVSNDGFMKDFVRGDGEELLKISFCAALTSAPGLIDFQFVKDARAHMSKAGWSYFLFELASRSHSHREIIKQCYELNDLETIDKLICVHGLRGQIPETEENLITESLVLELLSSSNDQEKSLGLTLCQITNLPHGTMLRLMLETYNKSSLEEIKEKVVSMIGSLEGNHVLQAIRGLLAKEKNVKIKNLLKSAEQQVKNANSQQGNRISWDQARRNKNVREIIWQSLRR